MNTARDHNLNFWNEAGEMTDADLFACADELRRRTRRLMEFLVRERGAGGGDILAALGYLHDEISVPAWDVFNKLDEIRVAP